MKEEFVEEIEIKEIKPCWTAPGRIFVEAKAKLEGENPLSDLIPILFLKYPLRVVVFNDQKNTLSLRMYDRGIGIFPSGTITMQNTKDEEEARQILEEIREVLNEAHTYLIEKGRPAEDVVRKRIDISKLSTSNIVKYLPNVTHCRKCGLPTCKAFAFKLLRGEKELKDCVVLKEREYNSMRKNLETILEELKVYE